MLYFLLWVVLFSLYLCAYSVLFVYMVLIDWLPLEIIQCLVRFFDLLLSVLSPYDLCIVVPPCCILLFLSTQVPKTPLIYCQFLSLICRFVFVSVDLFFFFYSIWWLLVAAVGDSYYSDYHRALVAFTLIICIVLLPVHFCCRNTP